ncbi:MAG: PAS domain S-box protein [Nostoc sp. TH1S01]|nr:PAS domain S-box protein [Nostoc sp. TH1S01]
MRLSNLFGKKPANNKKLKISLRLILTVPFVLLTGGTTGLVSYISLQNSQHSVNSLAYQLMTEMSDRIHLYLSNYLKTPHLINRLTAQAIEIQQLDVTNPQSLERYFFGQIQEFGSKRIHFINPQGGLVGAGNDERGLSISLTKNFRKGELYVYSVDQQGKRQKLLVHQNNYDGTQRPFYQTAISTGKPTWTPIFLYVPASRGLGIAASYPIYNQKQQLLGVVASDIDLVSISQFLKKLRVGTHGQVFIIDRSGMMVASSTSEQPFLTAADGKLDQQLKVTDSKEPLICLAGEYLVARFGNLNQIQTAQQLKFDIKGKKQFLLVIPYREQLGLDWLIVTVVPASDFTAKIEANTRLTIFFSLGALIGAIALGLLLTEFIVRPMQKLGQTSLALAKGQWHHHQDEDSLIAEIQVLRHSFNWMSQQLKQSYESVKTALQDSEERFTKVFLTCPEAMGIFTLNGHCLDVNDAFIDLYGYSRAEVIGCTVTTFQSWVNQEDQQSYLQDLLAGKKVRNQEFTVMHKTGKVIPVLISADMIELQGEPHIIAVTKNISDVYEELRLRKLAELELRQQKDLRESIYNESTDALFLVDPQTLLIIDCNHRAVELFEADSKLQLIGIQGHTLQSHPYSEDELTEITTQMQQQGVWSQEMQYLTCQGNLFWGNLAAKKVAIAHQVIYLVRVTDITERKRTELALRESEERFRYAFYDAPIGMALLGLDQNWLQINPMLCEILGYSELEFASWNSFQIIHPEDIDKFQQGIQQVSSAANRNAQMELRYLYHGGRIVWGLTSLSLVKDCQNQPLYYVLQIQDITEQQAIEQMKNEFISIVSHELRTPLTAIQGFLGLLNTGIYDNKPEKAKRMLGQALTNSDRLVRLVNDILDLERLSSGRVQLVKEVCNAADLMHRAAEGLQSIALAAGVTISITPTTAYVWAASDLIIQTLTNLLSNAIKFSPRGFEITLSARAQSDWVLFTVKDQGRGIPSDKLQTIFERFQQVDISDARAKGGTGLGLAICQSIIQQHDGSIWAESTLGEGSTFYFTLPIAVKET